MGLVDNRRHDELARHHHQPDRGRLLLLLRLVDGRQFRCSSRAGGTSSHGTTTNQIAAGSSSSSASSTAANSAALLGQEASPAAWSAAYGIPARSPARILAVCSSKMVNTATDVQDSGTNNFGPEAHLLCSLSAEQRIAWQAQILQTTAEHMAKLQEIVSLQASILKINNGVSIVSHQEIPSMPSLPPFDKGKLVAMQHQVLEGLTQQKNSHQSQDKNQIDSLKKPLKRQVVKALKSMKSNEGISGKPLGIQESCHCCRHYGLPCLQNNSSKVKDKTSQNRHPDVDKKRKAVSQEPQLESSQHLGLMAPSHVDKKRKVISQEPQLESSQHLGVTAPSLLVQCCSKEGPNPKEAAVPQVISTPHEIFLDGWSITYKEFQPRKGKHAKKQTSKLSEVETDYQNQRASDSLVPHGTSLKGAESHQGSTPGRACFHCQEEGHFVAHCPKKDQAGDSPAPHCRSLKGAQSHQGSTSGKAAGKVCFRCQEEGHLVAHCPKKYPLLSGNRDAQKQKLSPSEGKICNQTPVQVPQSSCLKGSSFICGDIDHSINESPKACKSVTMKLQPPQPSITPSQDTSSQGPYQPLSNNTSMKSNTPKKPVKGVCCHCREKGHSGDLCPQKNQHLLDGRSQNQIPAELEPPGVSDSGVQGQGGQLQENHTRNQANLEVIKEDKNTQSAI